MQACPQYVLASLSSSLAGVQEGPGRSWRPPAIPRLRPLRVFSTRRGDARHRAAGETRKEWRTIGYHVVKMLKPIDTNSQPAILEGFTKPVFWRNWGWFIIWSPQGRMMIDRVDCWYLTFWRSQGGSLRELWSYEDGCSQYVLEFGWIWMNLELRGPRIIFSLSVRLMSPEIPWTGPPLCRRTPATPLLRRRNSPLSWMLRPEPSTIWEMIIRRRCRQNGGCWSQKTKKELKSRMAHQMVR